MIGQILTIWTIVALAIVWFVLSERRQRAKAAMQQADLYAQQAPQYRYQSSNPAVPVTRSVRSGGLTETQLAFVKALEKNN